MGLLEKAQERKQTIDQSLVEEEIKTEEKEIPNEPIIEEQIKDKNNQGKSIEDKQNKSSHLFKKNETSKKEKSLKDKKVKSNSFSDKDDTVLYFHYKKQNLDSATGKGISRVCHHLC